MLTSYRINEWLRLIPAYRRWDDVFIARLNALCKSFYKGPIRCAS